MGKILFLFFIIFNISSFANKEIVNGKTEIIVHDKIKAGILTKKGKNIPWIPHPKDKSKVFTTISASYYEKNDVLVVNKINDFYEEIIFKIKDGNYSKSEIIQVDSKKVTPPKEQTIRIKKEREEANKIYNTFTKKIYWHEPFIKPMNSKITSPFGVARVFNGKLASYHSGTDFRASIGQPIKASNNGVIVIAKNRYFSGKSVVIDHGYGIYSCYYHLDSIDVKVGQSVKKLQIIGLSGNSGRVNGPHLHLTFMVQGIAVDPLDFIEKINSIF